MRETVTSEDLVAFHESGHAYMYYHIGIPFLRIEIDRDDQGQVFGYITKHPDFYEALTMDKYAPTCLGGFAAEHIQAGSPEKVAICKCRIESELTHLAEGYREILGEAKTIDQIFDQHFYDVAEILQEKWPAIRALAAALIEKRKLTGQEAFEIIEQAFYPEISNERGPKGD